MTGGDAIFALFALLLQDGGLIISFATYLARYAETVAWLPAAPLNQFADIVLLVVLLGLAYRIARAWLSKWRTS